MGVKQAYCYELGRSTWARGLNKPTKVYSGHKGQTAVTMRAEWALRSSRAYFTEVNERRFEITISKRR